MLFSSFFTSRSRVRRLVHVIRSLELELVAPYYSAVYCYEMIAFVADLSQSIQGTCAGICSTSGSSDRKRLCGR